MKISSFDWDDGNLGKLKKHNIPRSSIEDFISNYDLNFFNDRKHSVNELRFIVTGKYGKRDLFVVFTFRVSSGSLKVRIISARYLHKKELGKLYEKIKNEKESHG